MPQIMRPTSAVESLKRERQEFIWPAEAYAGTIEKVDSRPLPSTNDGRPFGGYTSTDGERINVTIGSNRPLDPAGSSVGNQKRFIDLTITDGTLSIFDAEEQLREAQAWRLLDSQTLVLNLALALGATTTTNGHVSVEDGFVDALRSGQYTGQNVGFVNYHRSYKARDGEMRTVAELETFMPAA